MRPRSTTFPRGPGILLAAALLLLAPGAHAQVSEADALPGARAVDADALRAYMDRVRAETDVPGLTLAVAVDGKVVFSEAVGYAELENRTPATRRTVHNAASVSKVIGAVGLMKLVEAGQVDLDAPIQEYLPYYPEQPEGEITLRGILTHTSGIRHYRSGEFGEHREREMRHYEDFEEATRIWRDDPLLYAPGSYWTYSSHAFNLIHGVVEAVTGRSLEEFMEAEVWEPAGMVGTSMDVPWRVVPHRGRGYVRDQAGRFREPTYADVSYKYIGGGMLSTSEDLVRLALALNDGTLLAPETVAAMFEPQLDESVRSYSSDGDHSPLDFEQALAWRVGTDPQGRRFVYHTGTVLGTRSFMGSYPEEGIAMALQANALPVDSEKYGRAVLQMLLPSAGDPAGPLP